MSTCWMEVSTTYTRTLLSVVLSQYNVWNWYLNNALCSVWFVYDFSWLNGINVNMNQHWSVCLWVLFTTKQISPLNTNFTPLALRRAHLLIGYHWVHTALYWLRLGTISTKLIDLKWLFRQDRINRKTIITLVASWMLHTFRTFANILSFYSVQKPSDTTVSHQLYKLTQASEPNISAFQYIKEHLSFGRFSIPLICGSMIRIRFTPKSDTHARRKKTRVSKTQISHNITEKTINNSFRWL